MSKVFFYIKSLILIISGEFCTNRPYTFISERVFMYEYVYLCLNMMYKKNLLKKYTGGIYNGDKMRYYCF